MKPYKSAIYFLKNKKAVSIVETLVAVGIMSIMMAGFASMLSSQGKETRALAEVLGVQDLQKSMIGIMAKGDVCQYMLQTKTFNAQAVQNGTAQEIDMGTDPIYSGMVNATTPGPVFIKKGDKGSAFSSSLVVENIKFVVDSGSYIGGNGAFIGHWIINFDSSKSVRKLKPVSIAAAIYANTSSPTAAQSTACLGNDSAATPNFANTSAVCSSTTEGQIRYDSATKKMSFCDGTSWAALSGTTNLPLGGTGSTGATGSAGATGSGQCQMGQVWSGYTCTWVLSDLRLKENVKTIKKPLEALEKIRGVTWTWKNKEFGELTAPMGIIAQDVEKVYPSLIKEENGIKKVQYTGLIGPLIEATRELNYKIELLKKQNSELKEQNSTIKIYLCGKDQKADFCK